jgi:hypothetical protein
MYNKGFHFEIHDLLTQFIAAMDDVVIARYNKDREEKEQIKVRYVHAPVQRILNDIVNKSQNITLPVIAVNINSITRDEGRVFNKIEGFYQAVKTVGADKTSARIPMPVPVNLGVSVSILTNYQSDMDQIISNFVPYSNPYIIISWKIPEEFNISDITEIRSEVLWSGTINTDYPFELDSGTKPRFQATTEFTIKGWLFPATAKDLTKNIYFIDSHLHTTNRINLNYDSFLSLSGDNTETETVSISAAPDITNLYLLNPTYELSGTRVVVENVNYQKSFNILGDMFQYTTYLLLSSDNNLYTNLTSFDFVYYPSVTGCIIPKEYYTVMSNNTIHLNLPPLSGEGYLNFVVVNPAGWKDTNSINTQLIYLSS